MFEILNRSSDVNSLTGSTVTCRVVVKLDFTFVHGAETKCRYDCGTVFSDRNSYGKSKLKESRQLLNESAHLPYPT